MNIDEVVTLFLFLSLTLNFVSFLICFVLFYFAYIVGAAKLVNTS